ncbi:CDP-glucose 4,6-dehydratase [Cohnella soli]|uniref:CDP-glucose 4,6-dehydratase n=1 Tax=Cohnella soli TaxID=425005 RepID=A0ABW0HMX4_9BACL
MDDFWLGKKVFVTGHTGFKGSWLSMWLTKLGAKVTGYALEPDGDPSLFRLASVGAHVDHVFGDVRHAVRLHEAMAASRPDIVFHLAAQPLVREAYTDPVGTYMTNVMGTVNVLEAIRASGTARAVIIVTTDKVYGNKEWMWGYREDERLGGRDPYSSSKACAELIVHSYSESFLKANGVAVATTRAGNIIGGGDWSADRLVPDLLKALAANQPIRLRYPTSVRPWQHVLAPLHGYLALAARLHTYGEVYHGAWNFGPAEEDHLTVHKLAVRLSALWGTVAITDQIGPKPSQSMHEAMTLKLDSTKARTRLGWHPQWKLDEALHRTVEWQKAYLRGADIRSICLEQINDYENAGGEGAAI